MVQSSNATRLMRIQARPGSLVEARHYRYPQRGWVQPDAIARGIPPDASADLVFHGGKTVPQMEFQNIFLGGQASWQASDIDQINTAITLAMQDRKLNNVVKQYFDSGVNLTCDARPLLVLEEAKPDQLDEPGVQQLVSRLLQQGKVSDSDLGTTIFNLLLPPGSVLIARPRQFARRAWRLSRLGALPAQWPVADRLLFGKRLFADAGGRAGEWNSRVRRILEGCGRHALS